MYNTVSVKTCSFVEADCHRVFSSIFMFEKDWRAHVLERLTRRGRKILEFFGTFSHSAQWFLKSSQHGDNVKISVHLVPFFFSLFVIVGNLRVFFYFLQNWRMRNSSALEVDFFFFAMCTWTEGISKGENTSIFADFLLYFRETFTDDRYFYRLCSTNRV